jgi:hypothetical protein
MMYASGKVWNVEIIAYFIFICDITTVPIFAPITYVPHCGNYDVLCLK